MHEFVYSSVFEWEHIYIYFWLWSYTDLWCLLFFEGLCKVDETPKGWYIQYIDRDPGTLRRQLELEKKKKQDLDDEEKTAKFIQEQVRRGLEGKEQVGHSIIPPAERQ